MRDALSIMDKRTNTRVFRNKDEVEIVQLILDEWRLGNRIVGICFKHELADFFDTISYPKREFTMQHNESDGAFIRRLLKRRGISWYFRADHGERTLFHTMVLLNRPDSVRENAAGTVRYHRDSATEERDSITSWSAVRTLQPGSTATHSWDYRNPLGVHFMSVAALGDADQGSSGRWMAASMDDYQVLPPHAGDDHEDLFKLGQLRMQRHDYETKCFHAEGSVRDLCVGEYFTLEGHPEISSHAAEERDFTVTALQVTAQNNLPKALAARVERLFARNRWMRKDADCAHDAQLHQELAGHVAEGSSRMHIQFTAVRRGVPIVPAYDPRTDLPQPQMQSAIVVGPEGEEVHCDEMGRVKIRFPGTRAQDHGDRGLAGANNDECDSAWVRVASNWAGNGPGHQSQCGTLGLPRIGSEVLVAFLGGDPDKPVIVGQLYNQEGLPPALSTMDGLPGNKHLSGIKSREIKGGRANQLRLDDTTGQISAQLASEHGRSELNLGYLTHPKEGGHGKPRGEGAELRSDEHIALRAAKGMLLSTWNALQGSSQLERGGHLALMEECLTLFRALGNYAADHQGVKLDSNQQNELRTAFEKWEGGSNTQPGGNGGIPVLGITAPAGISLASSSTIVGYAGSNIDMVGAQNLQLAAGGRLNVNAGRGIALFAQDGGVSAIAHQGNMLLQSQHGDTTINASGELKLTASEGKLTAVADEIMLVSKGGAFIRLGEGITFGASGDLTFNGSAFRFEKPATMKAEVPEFAAAALVPEELCKLESDFALQQLTGVARRCSEGEFIIFAAPVFGFDVPAPVYVSLYEALRDGRIPNARIVVVQGGVYPGAFDTVKREIVVHQGAACKAAKDAEAAWELLTVLLHEFGHHIDSVIREDLASSEVEEASPLKTDAEGDEGAKLAYALAFFDFENSVDTEFAQLVSQDYSGPLRVNYKDARNYIKLSQDDEAQRKEGKSGDLELFGASGEHVKQRPLESFGHEQIEQGLIAADKFVFDRDTRLHVYFGNWLRDYSQILDPKIIRPPGMPKDLTRYISRDTLTKVVDVLAEEKFVFEAASKKEFAVTKENLGVYRAVEHIDNPTNFDTNPRDNRAVDADFEPPPSATYLSIDAGSSMKHYIAASRDYMTTEACVSRLLRVGRIRNRPPNRILGNPCSHQSPPQSSLRYRWELR
nr:type VI secretion system tip protein TssI/VgrG [Pseudoduganella aquatica]